MGVDTGQDRGQLLFSVSLTEVVLLLVFLFLLLLVPQLVNERARADEQREALIDLQEQLHGYDQILQTLTQEFDDSEEFIRLVREAASQEGEIHRLEKQLSEREAAERVPPSGEELRKRQQEELRQLQEQALITLSELSGKIEEADLSSRDSGTRVTRLRALLANCERRIGRGGRDYPPCWIVSEDGPDFGREEYLLNITISDQGIGVEPGWPVHRETEAIAIPGVSAIVGQSFSEVPFRAHAKPVLDWSNAQNCRHYVRIFDQAETKPAFKSQLLAVEDSFYKWLSRN